MHLVPENVPGELVIGGMQVGRGYLNNPELTNSKFQSPKPKQNEIHTFMQYQSHSPHSPHSPYSPIYRTGDLARWLSDGNIEFLGRMDLQVKIRGFRVELGEIESRLLNHHQIREAVVLARDDDSGLKYLCAYIVSAAEFSAAELRDHLLPKLPDYMIPSYFVRLDKIPLTPNRKIHRSALPAPRLQTGQTHHMTPRNPLEKKLQEIWAEVLKIEKDVISINSNFFELGGHSLTASILVAKIHKGLHVKVPLGEVFKTPDIKGLYQYIKNSPQDGYLFIDAVEEKCFYELSYNQKRLWFLNQLEPESPAYHMPGRILLEHPVDESHIKKALYKIMERHESFRTGFNTVNDQPVQVIKKEVNLPFKKVDISSMNEKEKQQEIGDIYAREVTAPFNLAEAPLFRAILVKLDESLYDFIFNMHHIITDGWSMVILDNEFSRFYEGYRTGKEFEPEPLKLQYKDFAAWHNHQIAHRELKEKSHRFWREKLEKGIPTLNLPTDFSSKGNERKGAGYRCMLAKEPTMKLRKMAVHHNTSLFMVMYSLYILLLSRFSNQEHIASSIINAGRDHNSLHDIVGFFVNPVLFEIKVDYEEPFNDFLQRVHTDVLEIFHHQGYPIELVFEDLNMRYPEISVSFNMINIIESTTMNDPAAYQPHHLPGTQDVKFDIEPYITEYRNSIDIHWAYKKELFAPATIEYMVEEYSRLIDFFTGEIHKNYKDYKKSNKKHTFRRN
jgi:acyl carrier protein